MKRPRYHVRVLNPANWWKLYVSGDTDCKRVLLYKLANCAKETGTLVHINFGRRSRAEQTRLWRLYLAGKGSLAARPGTSHHETQDPPAADCVIDSGASKGIPVGQHLPFRRAMRKRGLCLPVGGEPWHVEPGNTWRA